MRKETTTKRVKITVSRYSRQPVASTFRRDFSMFLRRQKLAAHRKIYETPSIIFETELLHSFRNNDNTVLSTSLTLLFYSSRSTFTVFPLSSLTLRLLREAKIFNWEMKNSQWKKNHASGKLFLQWCKEARRWKLVMKCRSKKGTENLKNVRLIDWRRQDLDYIRLYTEDY